MIYILDGWTVVRFMTMICSTLSLFPSFCVYMETSFHWKRCSIEPLYFPLFYFMFLRIGWRRIEKKEDVLSLLVFPSVFRMYTFDDISVVLIVNSSPFPTSSERNPVWGNIIRSLLIYHCWYNENKNQWDWEALYMVVLSLLACFVS